MATREIPEAAQRVREALDAADEVDARRIDVVARASEIRLRGSVSSDTQLEAAATIAETAARTASPIVSELTVDTGAREAVEDPPDVEHAEPAENEVLVGSTDMLAGPDAVITDDMDQALSEDEPWIPPDTPALPDEGRLLAVDDGEDVDEIVLEPDLGRSAPDLTAADLATASSGASLPADTGEVVRLEPEPDPQGRDELGRVPDTDEKTLEPMVAQVPGTRAGPGAVGEHVTGGGSAGSVAATETGARGADTRAADPARSATGGVAKIAGTERGPQAREDEPLREDFPDEDPPA